MFSNCMLVKNTFLEYFSSRTKKTISVLFFPLKRCFVAKLVVCLHNRNEQSQVVSGCIPYNIIPFHVIICISEGGSRHKSQYYDERVLFFKRHLLYSPSQCFSRIRCVSRSALGFGRKVKTIVLFLLLQHSQEASLF